MKEAGERNSLMKNLIYFIQKSKVNLKNNYIWYKRGLLIKKNILDHYSSLQLSEINAEEKEVLDYLKNNPISLLPYNFVRKYIKSSISIFTDVDNGFKYTLYDNKRLYFKKKWSKKKIRKYYQYLLAEQDVDSPHRYLTSDFSINKGSILVDAGVAEGIFTLMNIDNISKGILFEPDVEWIEALKLTFRDYHDKITIINKFLGDSTSANHITLDDYISTDERVDFIKIDVEGHEMAVLKGADKLLSSRLKIVMACYHKHNDEIVLKKYLETYNFNCNYSRGYSPFYYDAIIDVPYLRRVLIRACKLNPSLL